jgi:hypothetical protein
VNSPPQDQPWQAPQNVWQQPSYGASPQPPQLPRRAGSGLGCAIAAIVAVVALVVIGGVIWGGVALYHLKDRIPGMHKEQFQTVAGLNRVMEMTRQRFGDTMGYQLSVGPESFSVERVDPDNPRKLATYYWYSWRGHFEDPTGLIDLDPTGVFLYPTGPADLSKFDANAVVNVLHDAPNILHVDATAVKSTFLTVRAAKDGPPGAPEEEVRLETSKGNGHIVLAADGTVKATSADF